MGRRPSFCFPGPRDGDRSTYGTIGRMEITWYGGSCVRLKGREGVVAADPYRAIVGPTGRGLTADIVTFSHAEDEASRGARQGEGRRSAVDATSGVPLPTSVESAFALDSPGEYEIHDVMVMGIRTFRDGVRGAERGLSTAYVYELDGLLTAHLGDVGHVLSQETLGEMGHVDIVCLAIGRALPPAPAAELVAQLGCQPRGAAPGRDRRCRGRERPRALPEGDERGAPDAGARASTSRSRRCRRRPRSSSWSRAAAPDPRGSTVAEADSAADALPEGGPLEDSVERRIPDPQPRGAAAMRSASSGARMPT